VPFEKLHRALMLLGGRFGIECSQVSALSGFRILLPRIKTVFA
jgi:hypothetical protein